MPYRNWLQFIPRRHERRRFHTEEPPYSAKRYTFHRCSGFDTEISLWILLQCFPISIYNTSVYIRFVAGLSVHIKLRAEFAYELEEEV